MPITALKFDLCDDLDMSQSRIQGENIGSVVEVRNSKNVKIGQVSGVNVGNALLLDGVEKVSVKSVSVVNDAPDTSVDASSKAKEDGPNVGSHSRWSNTKRFLREVSISALSGALVSSISSIPPAS